MEQTAASGVQYRLSEVIGALSHALDLTEGQPVGHTPAQLHDRHGARRAARPRRRGPAATSSTRSCSRTPGCSSSAARMCELFATDDRALKREFSLVDWTQHGRVRPLRRAATSPRTSSGIARARPAAARAAQHRGARPPTSTRPAATAAPRIVAMLGFPPRDRRGGARARRALGRQRPPGRAGGRRDPADLAASPAWRRRPRCSCPRTGPRPRWRWCASAAGAGSIPELADAFLAIGPDDPLWMRMAERRDGRGAARPGARTSRDRPGRRGAASTASPRRSPSVIDAKSPYTARHSLGVATYAVAIGERARLRPGAAALPAPRRRCCTTSASSASRTRSSTSRAS